MRIAKLIKMSKVRYLQPRLEGRQTAIDTLVLLDNKFCSKCSYPLTPQAYEEIKAQEDIRFKAIELKYQQDMKVMREELLVHG
jgi:hypothetical protein